MNEHTEFALLEEYLLGTLDAADTARVAAHLTICRPCGAEYDELRSVFDILPQALPAQPASAAIRERIFAAIDRPARDTRLVNAVRGLAAALVLAVAGDAFLALRQATPDPANTRLVSALRTGKVYAIDGSIANQAWHLTIVQPRDGRRAVVYSGTPDAPSGQTYRTWIVRHGRTIDAGALPAGRPTTLEMPMALASGDIVAFSREPVGTTSAPTTPFLMQRQIAP